MTPEGGKDHEQAHPAGRGRPGPLFVTALGREGETLAGYRAGADNYVTKPFSFPVLVGLDVTPSAPYYSMQPFLTDPVQWDLLADAASRVHATGRFDLGDVEEGAHPPPFSQYFRGIRSRYIHVPWPDGVSLYLSGLIACAPLQTALEENAGTLAKLLALLLALDALFRNLLEDMSPVLAGRRVEAHLAPVALTGDPDLLKRALGNVFAAAARYTPPGGRIALRLDPGPARWPSRTRARPSRRRTCRASSSSFTGATGRGPGRTTTAAAWVWP